jgi:hypothetical protein
MDLKHVYTVRLPDPYFRNRLIIAFPTQRTVGFFAGIAIGSL